MSTNPDARPIKELSRDNESNIPRNGINIRDTEGSLSRTGEVLAICEADFEYPIETFSLISKT
jgi:hypothetical protein